MQITGECKTLISVYQEMNSFIKTNWFSRFVLKIIRNTDIIIVYTKCWFNVEEFVVITMLNPYRTNVDNRVSS